MQKVIVLNSFLINEYTIRNIESRITTKLFPIYLNFNKRYLSIRLTLILVIFYFKKAFINLMLAK